jgi:hypothetical protein
LLPSHFDFLIQTDQLKLVDFSTLGTIEHLKPVLGVSASIQATAPNKLPLLPVVFFEAG